jgi:hypothetical protein
VYLPSRRASVVDYYALFFYCFIVTVWCHFAAATATFFALQGKRQLRFFPVDGRAA